VTSTVCPSPSRYALLHVVTTGSLRATWTYAQAMTGGSEQQADWFKPIPHRPITLRSIAALSLVLPFLFAMIAIPIGGIVGVALSFGLIPLAGVFAIVLASIALRKRISVGAIVIVVIGAVYLVGGGAIVVGSLNLG
jgi:hypothetical protein